MHRRLNIDKLLKENISLKSENARLTWQYEELQKALGKIEKCARHVVGRRDPYTWAQDIARAVRVKHEEENKEGKD